MSYLWILLVGFNMIKETFSKHHFLWHESEDKQKNKKKKQKQKQTKKNLFPKISVDSNFMFTSYVWLCYVS